jgi:phage baseplate assembly protein W
MATKIETAISLPFGLDNYGNVKKTYDQTKIWSDRVRSVIGTLQSERVMRATFGTKIASHTFDTETVAIENITREVRSAFAVHLPALQLDSVLVSFDENESVVNVEVVYDLPNQTQVTTGVGLAYISGNKLVSEVNQ